MVRIALNLIVVIITGSLIDLSENSVLSLQSNNGQTIKYTHNNYNNNEDKIILTQLVNNIGGWTTNSTYFFSKIIKCFE